MHGAVLLRSNELTADQVQRLAADHRTAGLPAAEVAMLDLVEKVVLHAYKVTPEDMDGLRSHGFSDEEILDIVLAASARAFMSKTLDAVGVEPDAAYLEADPGVARVLRGSV